jgi:hypothetical protein
MRELKNLCYNLLDSDCSIHLLYGVAVSGTDDARIPMYFVMASKKGSLLPDPVSYTWLFSLWPGFIHGQSPVVHHSTIQSGDGRPACGLVGHFDKAKSPGHARFAVVYDPGGYNLAIRCKKSFQVFFADLSAEVSDKNVHDSSFS